MSAPIPRRGLAALAAAGALLTAGLAATQASAATFYACTKKNGSAHIFKAKPKCKRGESKLSWNEGSAGRNGANGLNGANGKEGVPGREGKDGKEGKEGRPGVAPNVFVGDKELKGNFAALMSLAIPPGSAAGGTISFTILATDGGSQAVTEAGTIYWNAVTNAVTCKVDATNNLHLGTVNAACVPSFFSPGTQPGCYIDDNPSFSTPAPVVVNHVWFTITNNSGDLLRLE
jgi:Collagen triple helix repeat (20 copies)